MPREEKEKGKSARSRALETAAEITKGWLVTFLVVFVLLLLVRGCAKLTGI